jgi:hypothetical protein
MNGHWASLLATETDSNKRLHFANAKYTDPIVHSACLYPCTVDDSKRIVHLHLHGVGRSRAESLASRAGRCPDGRWLRAHTSSSLSWAGRRVDGGIGGLADGGWRLRQACGRQTRERTMASISRQTSALARRAGGRRTQLGEQTTASAWLANRGLVRQSDGDLGGQMVASTAKQTATSIGRADDRLGWASGRRPSW